METDKSSGVFFGDNTVSQEVKDLSIYKKTHELYKKMKDLPKGTPKSGNFNLVVEKSTMEENFPFNLGNRIEIYPSKEKFKRRPLISAYLSTLGPDSVEIINYRFVPDQHDEALEVKGRRVEISFDDLVFMVRKPIPQGNTSVYQFITKSEELFDTYYRKIKPFL
jgi:hypothetical protein